MIDRFNQLKTTITRLWNLPADVKAYSKGYTDGSVDAAEAVRRFDGYVRSLNGGGFAVADEVRSQMANLIAKVTSNLVELEMSLRNPKSTVFTKKSA